MGEFREMRNLLCGVRLGAVRVQSQQKERIDSRGGCWRACWDMRLFRLIAARACESWLTIRVSRAPGRVYWIDIGLQRSGMRTPRALQRCRRTWVVLAETSPVTSAVILRASDNVIGLSSSYGGMLNVVLRAVLPNPVTVGLAAPLLFGLDG